MYLRASGKMPLYVYYYLFSRRYCQSMKGKILSLYILILATTLLLLSDGAFAQFYNGSQMEFGRKRLQYRDFVWTYYRYDRFDTYFYRGGEGLANQCSAYADSYLDEIERKLKMRTDDKFKFIVYNTLDDLKQSNIGYMTNQQYNTGGITHILDNKVFLYFNGDITHLNQQIRAGIARILIDHMTQGGSIGNQIKNSTLMDFPSWYIDGLVSYLSNPWGTDIDNLIKDGFISGKYGKFNHLQGEDARLAGHSLWFFIASKYGETVIPDIVYMAKSSRNTDAGFTYVINISFKTLITEWENFFNERYLTEDEGRELPVSDVIKAKPNKKFVYDRVRISPDGKYIAFSYNEVGKYKVYIQDIATGKKKKVLSRGNRLNEKVDFTYPILAWHPSGELLSVITIEKGVVRLNFYNVNTKEKEKINLVNYQQILDASYSPDGSKLLLSAVKNSHSDIFIFDIASGSNMQLTDDIYNDMNPRFINGMKQIIFSSNRPTDTLAENSPRKGIVLRDKNDLFILNYPDKDGLLRRVTNTPFANEKEPREVSPGRYMFLSDVSGIYNRHLAVVDSSIAFVDTIAHYKYFNKTFPVTNYSRSVVDYDIDPGAGYISEIVFHNQRYYTYYSKMDNYTSEPLGTMPETTGYMDEVLRSNLTAEDPQMKIRRNYKRFVSVYEPDLTPGLPLYDRRGDTFPDDSLSQIVSVYTGMDSMSVFLDDPVDYFKPGQKRNYYVEFSINELVTQVDFNSLNYSYQQFSGGTSPIYLNAGFNVFTQIGVTDILEDYRIIGGVKLGSDLTNNEYIINYSDLSGKIDKELILHRKADILYQRAYFANIRNHELLYKLSLPLNRVLYVAATGILRSDKRVYLATDPYNLSEFDLNRNWTGLKAELVFDNSFDLSDNIPVGTKFKVFGEYFQLINNDFHNLYVAGFDLRRYDRLHRTLIWANRLSASTSLGTDRLIYYMGGVDNWIGARFDQNTPISNDVNYAYQSLATNMHGFDQNIRNGNSFMLFNTEVRWPIFQHLFNRPLSSEFLNNFQIVGFGDVGTAWTGIGPYSQENALYREEHSNGSISVIVDVQKEPIVAGYGMGVRTRLLGYFMRLDCSWGLNDWEVQPAKWYFGLGLDF